MSLVAILIEYDAIPNANEGAGFLPALWVNGHAALSSWATVGYDEAEALRLASQRADDEAGRYVGDWDITVRRRRRD